MKIWTRIIIISTLIFVMYSPGIVLGQCVISPSQGETALNIGFNHLRNNEFEIALDFFEIALQSFRCEHNKPDEAETLIWIGVANYNLSRFQDALLAYETALPILQQTGQRTWEAIALNNLGEIHRHLGNYSQALEYFNQALDIYQNELHDREGEAAILSNIGIIYSVTGQNDRAEEYFQSALEMAQEIDDGSTQQTALNNLGNIYYEQGRYTDAEEYLQRSVELAIELNDPIGQSHALTNIGSVYIEQGRFAEALETLRQALDISEGVGDRVGVGAALNQMGKAYNGLGQYVDAKDAYDTALFIAQEIDYPAGEAATLDNIAGLYVVQGNYTEALDYYFRGLQIDEQVGNLSGIGVTLNNIGRVYDDTGQYAQALVYYEEALGIHREVHNRAEEGTTLANIGAVYFDLGQHDLAIDYFEQALAIVQDTGNRAEEASILTNIGYVYIQDNRYTEAQNHLEQSLTIQQEIHTDGDIISTLTVIGFLNEEQGNYLVATGYYQEALQLAETLGDTSGESVVLNNLGSMNHSLGNYDDALDYYEQSLTISRRIGDKNNEIGVLSNTGILLEDWGRSDQAITYYIQAIDLIETVHTDIGIESNQISYMEQDGVRGPYNRLVGLLSATDPTSAFMYAERARARSFLFQISNEHLTFGAGAAPADIEAWQAKRDEITALREALVELATQPNTREAQLELEATIANAEEELDRIANNISSQNPLLGEYVGIEILDLTTIQNAIPRDTTILSYYIVPAGRFDEGHVFAFILTSESFNVLELDVTPSDLNESVSVFRSTGMPINGAIRLYEGLIAPLEDYLDYRTHPNLVIVPHGILNYVPFAALSINGFDFLADSFTISYTPSVFTYTHLIERESIADSNNEMSIVLGNPTTLDPNLPFLPSAENEAIEVARILNVNPIIGENATEGLLIQQANTANIIHIAAHGKFNTYNPLSSYLALAPDSENDGFFEVREVYALLDLQQQSPIVVLSACETAVNTLSNGDEFQSLPRAFLLSGADTVIASLWPVDDSATQVLMVSFYENRAAGMSDVQALAAAQRTVRENTDNPYWIAPYYWAGFVLIG